MATIEKRIGKKGRVQYRVKLRLRGQRSASATFRRLTDAKRWADETSASIREGRYFERAEAKRHTLADLIDRYIAEYLPTARVRHKDERKRHLSLWRDRLGHVILAELTAPKIQEARAKLVGSESRYHRPLAPATVNRRLASLSAALSVAVKNFGWLSDSPLRRLDKLAEPRARTRFLSADERAALLRECQAKGSDLYCIVALAIATGARKGELLNLRWQHVDMQRGLLTFHETKNGERRSVPLSRYARDLLAEHAKVRRIDTDFVFPGRTGRGFSFEKRFDAARKRAMLADFRFHDLRHTAASELAMNGATLAEIAEVLGHKTLQMVKRYAHLTEGHTRGVLERMNSKVFG
jgi:integrase